MATPGHRVHRKTEGNMAVGVYLVTRFVFIMLPSGKRVIIWKTLKFQQQIISRCEHFLEVNV